jgi:hypothetical protein
MPRLTLFCALHDSASEAVSDISRSPAGCGAASPKIRQQLYYRTLRSASNWHQLQHAFSGSFKHTPHPARAALAAAQCTYCNVRIDHCHRLAACQRSTLFTARSVKQSRLWTSGHDGWRAHLATDEDGPNHRVLNRAAERSTGSCRFRLAIRVLLGNVDASLAAELTCR